jgi:AcrR family transcriptional regulator
MTIGSEDGRRTRHAHRKRELLDAATDYVFAHGLHKLSLRPLGAALGVSHRTLLHHFGTKEQLFSEVLREARMRERLLVAAQLQGTADMPPADVLRSAWRRSIEHLPFFRVYYEVQGLALQDPERYASFLDGVVTDWVSLIAALLQQQDGVTAERAETLATLVWAGIRGLQLDLLTTGDHARVNRALEELASTLDAALAADADGDSRAGVAQGRT